MARPPRFSADELLDAALRLAAAGGPAHVTMSAVAADAGAPSGSVYHRFPGRPALLAELWLRTAESFQDGYLAALGLDPSPAPNPGESPDISPDISPDPLAAARSAARHVVSWCRAHPAEAAVLRYGADDFGRADWSAQHRRRADEGDRRVRDAVAALAAALGARTPHDVERVALAVVELPYAVVRRHLRGASGLPAYAEALAEESAAVLLTRGL